MKLNFNSYGLYIGISETEGFDSPDATLNQHRFKLVDGAVVDGWPDVTDENIMDSFNAEMEANAILDLRKEGKSKIKSVAKSKIEELGWKVERATEQDAINQTNTLADVYAEREAIRVASNAAEAEIDSLSTFEDIQAVVIAFRNS